MTIENVMLTLALEIYKLDIPKFFSLAWENILSYYDTNRLLRAIPENTNPDIIQIARACEGYLY